ncbi:MAG: MMPL family transporter [Gammaproteobacteria bacterium]|nr:MMPL family transporter [Gammaproteobacteria bacterium]
MLRQYSEILLRNWVRLVCRAAPVALLVTFTLAFFAMRYTADNISMNTDTEDMLSAELVWRQLDQEYERLFPQYDNNILIVLEAATPDQAADAALLLYQRLQADQDLFEFVYYPSALSLFRESGLLYLDRGALQDLSDNLAEVQPLLARLARDPTLVGLSQLLGEALDAAADGQQVAIEPVLSRINAVLESLRDGQPQRLSWQALMSADEQGAGQKSIGPESIDSPPYREFILTQPKLDYADFFPATPAIEKIRQVYAELELAASPGAELRLSGATMLAHEEMQSVMQGTETAVLLALCLVAVIMLTGLGSVKLALATVLSLLIGLIYTAAFAILTVTELNLISVAFAVLYIGLGVDFAIHYCLRYREQLLHRQKKSDAILASPGEPYAPVDGAGRHAALEQTSVNIGGSLFLCAVSTAIGFFAFIPTDYSGVAELGWISGVGMFISFLVTLTVLPALLSLLAYQPGASKPDPNRPGLNKLRAGGGAHPVERHAGKILGVTVFLALASALTLGNLRFDHNPLNLHAQDGGALTTYRELLADNDLTPWTAIMIAADAAEADRYRAAFNRSDLIKKVVTVADFIPAQQEDKLFLIDELNLLLGDLTVAPPRPDTQTDAARRAALHKLLEKLAATGANDPLRARLRDNLAALLQAQEQAASRGHGSNRQDGRLAQRGPPTELHPGQEATTEHGNGDELAQLEQLLLASLPGRLDALAASLNAGYISLDTLPEQFKRFWVSADGKRRLEIYPQQDLQDSQALTAFVRAVQAVSPAVTGAPVINLEASAAVATAFKQAFGYAFIAITLMLYLLLRHKKDVLLVLLPLLTAALLTGAVSVLIDLPLNFANVIALPLLLGIGVDSGIHIMHRFRTDLPDGKNILATSSARAVIVSSLTTMGGVGNLALSPHAGTASMGLLLTLGIGITLVCMLLVLPALLTFIATPHPSSRA